MRENPDARRHTIQRRMLAPFNGACRETFGRKRVAMTIFGKISGNPCRDVGNMRSICPGRKIQNPLRPEFSVGNIVMAAISRPNVERASRLLVDI